MIGRDVRAGRAVLVVEVSVSSRRVDLGTKTAIYAAAGIPECWVLDVEGRALLVHTQPVDGSYTVLIRHDEHATVTAARVAVTVAVDSLL